MAGGIWNKEELPVLPGFYLNFTAAALAAIQPGARGVVVLPVRAHWGPVREFKTIYTETDITRIYTDDETGGANVRKTIRMALLGGAQKVLAYRLADDNAQSAAITLQDTTEEPVNVLKLETLYPTTRSFKVTVQDNPLDESKKDIKLYEGSSLLRTFTYANGTIQAAADAINNDPGNEFIKATKLADGNGVLANVSNQSLSGGNDGLENILAADYIEFLEAAETQQFNLISLDGIADETILATIKEWVIRLRNEGKGIMAVLGGSAADDIAPDAVAKAIARSTGFNYEGIINVGVGGRLDGVNYSSAQIAPYVAGLIGGQRLSESTTYAATPFDDVTRRWTRNEQELAIKNGVFLLIHDGTRVKVLRGINTRTKLELNQNNSWKKIRAIRVMDAFNSDMLAAAEEYYIGKINNTEEGRLALIGAFKRYMEVHAQAGTIEAEGWDVWLDPDYHGPNATMTPEADQVYPVWTARLTDTMEIILGRFIVQ